MKKKEITVLIVEDNPGHILLIRKYLRTSTIIRFKIEVAEKVSTGIDLAVESEFDIVLLDLGLPDCNGLETFVRFQSRIPGIPIIILSALDDEEIAIKAVKNGATDYLVKGEINSDQLIRVIRYSIERKQAEERLKESEERYRTLVENSPIPIYVHSEGKFVFLNPEAVKRLGGTSIKDFIGKPVMDLIHQDDHKFGNKRLKRIYNDRKSIPILEEEFIRLDGNSIWIESMEAAVDYNGKPASQVVFSDITERKKAEEKMKRSMMRYKLEEGNLYMVKEAIPAISLEAFKDILKIGYRGLVISRMSEGRFRKHLEGELEILRLSETGKNSLSPDLVEVRSRIEGMPRKTTVFMDRIDYLITRNGFDETLSFVQELVDIAYFGGLVVIISLDPSTLSKKEMRLLEKEGIEIEPRHRGKMSEDLLKLLKFIYHQNIQGVKPSYTEIGTEMEISRPTLRKRIAALCFNDYVRESDKGRTKILELTEKGLRLFNE